MPNVKKQEYYRKNREKRLKYQRDYYELNKERIKKNRADRMDKEPDRMDKERSYNKEYYKKNKERIMARRKAKERKWKSLTIHRSLSMIRGSVCGYVSGVTHHQSI